MRKYSSAGRRQGRSAAAARRRADGTRGRVLPDSMRGTGRRAGEGSAMAGRGTDGDGRAGPSERAERSV